MSLKVIRLMCAWPRLSFKPNYKSIRELNKSGVLLNGYERRVPKTLSEFEYQNSLTIEAEQQPDNPRLLKVSVIGVPNAGKSTLTNQLIGWRVCPVSSKVHTTRNNAAGVLLRGDAQIVFLDTPGLVTSKTGARHKLEHSLVSDPLDSLSYADLIMVVVDTSNQWTRRALDPIVLQTLDKHQDKMSVLVLNKCDLVKSNQILHSTVRKLTCETIGGRKSMVTKTTVQNRDLLETLFRNTEKKLRPRPNYTPDEISQSNEGLNPKGWPHFQEVFKVSSLDGQGISDILDFLVKTAKPHPWVFHPSIVTNQNPQELAILTVREKFLDRFQQEVPYKIKIELEMWELEDVGTLRIAMNVLATKTHLVKKVIGRGGETIAEIVQQSQQELSNMFRCDVVLKLIVK